MCRKIVLLVGVLLPLLAAAGAAWAGAVQISSPTDGQTVSGVVPVAASTSSNVSWVDFYVDGDYRDSSPPYVFDWNADADGAGRHTLSVNAFDSNDNLIGSYQISVTVGTATSPSSSSSGAVSLTAPANGATVSGTVTISAQINSSSVQWINVYIDGNYYKSSPPLDFSWDSSAAGSGTHSITVRAYDYSNQNIGTDTVNVNVSSGASTGNASYSGGSGNFTTLPPGSALPSDQTCAQEVAYSSWEPRPDNYTANNTVPTADQLAAMRNAGNYGGAPASYFQRVTGNFTGTTDEILQWGACKWGFDVNLVRAIAANESWWHQSATGDDGVTFGILQIKSTDYPDTAPMSLDSTAFNVDWKLAYQRACFEGQIGYLQGSNGYPNGNSGNMLWGCVGQWYSGQWYDSGAQDYISTVQSLMNDQPWAQPGF